MICAPGLSMLSCVVNNYCQERADLLSLLYVMFSCVFVTFTFLIMVSWVGCGI